MGKVLTQTELEMMQVLWQLGEGSVRDVLEALPKQRTLAYTSVSTILRILEQKGFLKSRKLGRGHLYSPCISKAQYEDVAVTNIVNKVFDGAPSHLVRCLLQSEKLDQEELREIQNLIEKSL